MYMFTILLISVLVSAILLRAFVSFISFSFLDFYLALIYFYQFFCHFSTSIYLIPVIWQGQHFKFKCFN